MSKTVFYCPFCSYQSTHEATIQAHTADQHGPKLENITREVEETAAVMTNTPQELLEILNSHPTIRRDAVLKIRLKREIEQHTAQAVAAREELITKSIIALKFAGMPKAADLMKQELDALKGQ